MLKNFLRRFLISPTRLKENRWLRCFHNVFARHPRIWLLSRRAVARGVAIGLFCGLVPGPLQVLSAAGLCVWLRANLPVAFLMTLYTNPLTIGPIYWLAYQLGCLVLGQTGQAIWPALPVWPESDWLAWGGYWLDWIQGLGKPLLVGIPLLAVLLALIGYVLVDLIWRAHLVWSWHHRHPSVR